MTTKVPVRQTTGFPLSEEYISPPLTVVNGGTVTLTHGLANRPKLFAVTAVCIVSQLGWAVGETVLLHHVIQFSNIHAGIAIGIENDAEIFVKFGVSGAVAGSKATGALTPITPANWNIFITAWA